MIDVSRPNSLAPAWKTLTAMVEMKIGKLRPNVPIRNSMNSTALRSGASAT